MEHSNVNILFRSDKSRVSDKSDCKESKESVLFGILCFLFRWISVEENTSVIQDQYLF